MSFHLLTGDVQSRVRDLLSAELFNEVPPALNGDSIQSSGPRRATDIATISFPNVMMMALKLDCRWVEEDGPRGKQSLLLYPRPCRRSPVSPSTYFLLWSVMPLAES
jgi:hypothetical protein